MKKLKFPTLRLHKGSGQALVEHNGERHYLGKYGSAKAKANYAKFIENIVAKERGGAIETPAEKPATFYRIDEFLDAFLDWARLYYRDPEGNTTNEYSMLRYAVGPVIEHFEDLLVRRFGPNQLKTVRQWMIGQGWSRKHINHQVQRIRRAFRWGVENGYVPADVLAAVSAVEPLKKNRSTAREKAPVKPVSDEHIDAVLPHLSPTVRAMVQLQRKSGMRPQNICLLTLGEIDRTREVWVYEPKKHKTAHAERTLTVHLGPQSQAIINSMIFGLTEEDYVFSPRRSAEEYRERRRTRPRKAIAISRKPRKLKRFPGNCYNTRSYRRAIYYGIRKANTAIATHLAEELRRQPTREELDAKLIPHWHPHQLRHSRGTEVRNQFGLEAAQVTLGHSKANVTEIYAERDLELAEKVARETG